jgi:hypothetical protein
VLKNEVISVLNDEWKCFSGAFIRTAEDIILNPESTKTQYDRLLREALQKCREKRQLELAARDVRAYSNIALLLMKFARRFFISNYLYYKAKIIKYVSLDFRVRVLKNS